MTNNIADLEFVAFDTETTGLSPFSESLVEIAAVRFNLIQGPIEYFQTLVNPGKEIPWQATKVHGITNEMVFEAPPIEKVLPPFFQFLGDSIPVAHNAGFDIGFISLYSLRHEINPTEQPILDSCMFSRRVLTEEPSHGLEALVRSLKITSAGASHRALEDTKHCMELFRILVGRSCGINASWEDLLKIHGKTYSFNEGSRPLEEKETKSHLLPLFEALRERSSIWIEYDGGFGPREVSPLMVYAKGAQQYLEATCHLDGVRKSFRLDKIRAVRDYYNQHE